MSRMQQASRNTAVALIFFAATTLLSFFSRKIFLDHLGTDILGLNTLLNSIIDFMLLMELGIGSAIGVSLYKPLSENNTNEIVNIVKLIKGLYRILALVIVGVALCLTPLLPLLVGKSTVTPIETLIGYSIFVISSASNYFFGYGRVLFMADQRNYIPQTLTNSITITKVLLQMLAVYTTNSYWWWLGIEIIFQLTTNISIERLLHRYYPYIKETATTTLRELIAKYRDIFSNAKRIAIHHLAGFVLKQSDNIVIATMINLSSVALYGNYYLINSAVNGITYNVLQNSWSGIGNLVATESKEKIYSVYKEFLVANFFIVVTLNLCVAFLVEDFIVVWLGKQYVLSYNIVIAMVSVNILGGLTNASAAFLVAYKLFKDIWVPISEAVLNIIISIIGAYYFGLLGVIMGTAISILISSVWKPIYLHRKGVKMPLKPFLGFVAKVWGVLIISVAAIYLMVVRPAKYLVGDVENLGQWLVLSAIVVTGILVIFGGAMYTADNSFRGFCVRITKHFTKNRAER